MLLRAHSSAAAPQDQNTKQDAKNMAKDLGKNTKMPANQQTRRRKILPMPLAKLADKTAQTGSNGATDAEKGADKTKDAVTK